MKRRYHRLLLQKYHILGGSNSKHISQFGRLASLSSKFWQIWRLVRVCFLVHRWLFSYRAEKVRKLSGVSFIREWIPFMRYPPPWPNHLPKVSPLNTITLVIRFSIHAFGGNTSIQTIVYGNSRFNILRCCQLFSKATAPFYNLSSDIWSCQLLHHLSSSS